MQRQQGAYASQVLLLTQDSLGARRERLLYSVLIEHYYCELG